MSSGGIRVSVGAPEALDVGVATVARVRALLPTADRAVPTMELARALGVSARLASRMLSHLEAYPEHRSLTDALRTLNVLDGERTAQVIDSADFDDAVLHLMDVGMDAVEARRAVDGVVLEMAIVAASQRSPHLQLLGALAQLAGVLESVAVREGAAATVRRLITRPASERIPLARAFALASDIPFDDAWAFASALRDVNGREAVVVVGERIDEGTASAASSVLVRRIGMEPQSADRLAAELLRAFSRTSDV